jgi:hypothetical protein
MKKKIIRPGKTFWKITAIWYNREIKEVEAMFEKKQIIYSETQGVCRVDNIVSLSASRGEQGVPYYVLRSVFDQSKVSYIPVDNHQVRLRELFTKEEALALESTEEPEKDEKLKQAIKYVLGKEG